MSGIDVTKLSIQIVERLDEQAFVDAWFYHLIDSKLSRLCESPIEVMLGAALLFLERFDGMPGFTLVLAGQHELPHWPRESRLLIPQYKFEEYRVDWVYRDGDLLTFIECDGHDYHERTKAQAARDKQRDRKMQAAGHPVLRFTGSEIFKDPFDCARHVMQFVNDRMVPPEHRASA